MEAKNIRKVHCLFEQSGTFKNEFIKLGIPAEDYDIQNNFNQTDHVVDLFAEIEKEYDNINETRRDETLFSNIAPCQDLVLAFFPCIYFCDNNVLWFSGTHINYKHWKLSREEIFKSVIERSQKRQFFYELLLKLFTICEHYKIRLIFENPYNTTHYLHNNFPMEPAIIDTNRRLRGDFFKKPTQYFFLNCEPTYGFTEQDDKPERTICGLTGRTDQSGLCSEERSMISPDYARNFICDFIIGKAQNIGQLQFDFEAGA